jgi:regulatory protein
VAQSWQVQRSSSKCNTPLDRAGLDRLAIAYVGRYATTRAKLAAYLRRKLAERGWEGPGPAPVEAIVERCAELGYVDDRAFAEARAVSLTRRGYGPRRLAAALLGAGIEPDDMAQARERAEEDRPLCRLAARPRRTAPRLRGDAARGACSRCRPPNPPGAPGGAGLSTIRSQWFILLQYLNLRFAGRT